MSQADEIASSGQAGEGVDRAAQLMHRMDATQPTATFKKVMALTSAGVFVDAMDVYLAGGVKSIVWLVLIILITWTAGLLLGRQNAKTPADKSEKAAIQHRKKIISTFCAISCFGLLFAMKYWNFTLELLPTALGVILCCLFTAVFGA
mgnify:CR=1 FL=1